MCTRILIDLWRGDTGVSPVKLDSAALHTYTQTQELAQE